MWGYIWNWSLVTREKKRGPQSLVSWQSPASPPGCARFLAGPVGGSHRGSCAWWCGRKCRSGSASLRLAAKSPQVWCGRAEHSPCSRKKRRPCRRESHRHQLRLTQQIAAAIDADVIPAYKAFASFLSTDYAPHGRTTLAVTSLPDGEKRYQNDIYGRTTTHMSPDEIHQLGLREIERIQGEMLEIAKKQGFADLASFRASLKTNSKYIPTSADQILDDFRHYIAQMEPKLPNQIG